MSTSPVNYNLQNLYGQSGPQNLFGAGSNQYGGGWPTYPSSTPTSVPSSGPYNSQTPSIQGTQGGYYTGTSYDPSLTSNLFGYLQSQVGQGLPTYPGQLTAPPNQLYGQLGSLLTGGSSNLPYGQQMLQMAQTGDPTDVGPAWQAMIAASQQNIAQNEAQLKEQFAAGGNLVGSPYGTAVSDYQSQTALGENAILTQAQQQAAEAAAGRQLSAQQGLTSADLSLGGNLQNIAQQGATNAYNEWLRTQPQYNPLLGQAYGGATTFPPYLNPQQSPWAMIIPAILNMFGPGGIKIPGLPGGGGGGGGGGSSKPPTGGGPGPSGGVSGPSYGVNYPWNFPMPQPGGLPQLPGADTGSSGTSISYDSSGNPVLIDPNTMQPVQEPVGVPPGYSTDQQFPNLPPYNPTIPSLTPGDTSGQGYWDPNYGWMSGSGPTSSNYYDTGTSGDYYNVGGDLGQQLA